jgi:hypothetical protein
MIRPGDLTVIPIDYTAWNGSMAALIEEELNRLLLLDGLPALPTDPTDREVRDRRRLFVAIARAVVRHLKDQAGAIDVQRVDGTIVHPTFHTDGV